MAHNTEAGYTTGHSFELARLALAPLRAIDTFLGSISEANRLAHEVETLSHASDSQLAAMGLTRSDVAQYVAGQSEMFRTC